MKEIDGQGYVCLTPDEFKTISEPYRIIGKEIEQRIARIEEEHAFTLQKLEAVKQEDMSRARRGKDILQSLINRYRIKNGL